jgi:protein MpaA
VAPWPGRAALLDEVEAAGDVAIGRSVEGRAIASFGWGVGACTVVVGAVHGDEPASALAAWRICRAEPPAAGRVVVVPILNPDGFLRHEKNNARGVDLNRNFPGRSFGTERRPGYDPGPSPASEPETQALLAILAREHPVRVLAIHQPFACVNYDGPARAWAEVIAAASGFPVRADIGYATPGSLGTALGVEGGLPVVTLELGAGTPEEEWPRAEAALRAALAATLGLQS